MIIKTGQNTGGTMMRNKIVTGLIAGAAVGVVAGLLFAPKPGKESRRIVASHTGNIRYKTGGYVDLVRSWRKNKIRQPVLVGPYEWRSLQELAAKS
jgi:gas vesicle protein